MSHLTRTVHTFLVFSTLVVSPAAQSVPRNAPSREKAAEVSTSPEAGNQDEALSPRQRRALWLLVQLFEQAKGCDDETFRIRIEAQIADLLWKHDEARARLQFEETLRAIEAMKPELQADPSDSPPPPEYGLRYQLRQEVFELIAHHDSEWARKLGGPAETDRSNEADLVALDAEEANQTVARTQAAASRGSQATAGGLNPPLKLSLMMRSVGHASVSDLLNQAEMARNLSEKDRLYSRAARQVLDESDFERALSLTEKIRPGLERSTLESTTRQRAARAALSREDFVAADRYVRDITNLVQRAVVYDEMLRALVNRKDIGRAVEVLIEAEQTFQNADDGPNKAYALLIIAGAAARIDPLRGFDCLKSAVVAINHAEPDNKSRGGDGWTDLDLGSSYFDRVLTLLARVDFDRVLQLTQSIDKKEFSVFAQFAICRGLLTQPSATQ